MPTKKNLPESKARAANRLTQSRQKYSRKVKKAPEVAQDPQISVLEKIAYFMQQILGKDSNITVNVPEQKVADPQIAVNVPEQQKPSIIINVPEQKAQPAPIINVKVPAQPAPVVNVETPDIKFPGNMPTWNKINMKIVRDNRGLMSDVILTRES